MSNATETQPEQFQDTPAGWAQRLTQEFKAAKESLKEWHAEARLSLDVLMDKRPPLDVGDTHWNIYTSDTQTQEAMLFGKTPKTDVSRRFADADDDVARVAAEIQERILNTDIERDDDTFLDAVAYAHEDRQRVSFGAARVRYVTGEVVTKPATPAIKHPQTGAELAPEVPATEERPDEQVETDYLHWEDVLWSPCRVWHEATWIAFRAQMSKADAAKKFGKVAAESLPMNSKKEKATDGKTSDPWARVDVWEVWVKDGRQVFFFVEGHAEVLTPEGVQAQENGGVPDPLGLRGFWPCPRFMLGNTTTSRMVPKPDYILAKDLYESVNTLSSRVSMLTKAVRVVGVYDKNSGALAQMLNGHENKMVPVDSWAALAEKGGIKGVVDWFPIEQVVNTLTVLRDVLNSQVDQLRQMTGMSDIMRGQASEAGTTATSDRITARFGSVRMQKRQQELARFTSDLQKLRAEVMAKHFADSTYLARCNCESTKDKALAPQAVALIKSDFAKYRVEVKPENISMTDFDALKQERTEVITAIAQYMQAVQPIGQAMPSAMPFLLQILQWMVAGIRGGGEIEAVLDQAIAQAAKVAEQPQQQQQDPKLAQISLKGQTDMAKTQMEHQQRLVELGAEAQAEDAKQRSQTEWNVKETAMKIAMTPPKMVGPNGAPQR